MEHRQNYKLYLFHDRKIILVATFADFVAPIHVRHFVAGAPQARELRERLKELYNIDIYGVKPYDFEDHDLLVCEEDQTLRFMSERMYITVSLMTKKESEIPFVFLNTENPYIRP